MEPGNIRRLADAGRLCAGGRGRGEGSQSPGSAMTVGPTVEWVDSRAGN